MGRPTNAVIIVLMAIIVGNSVADDFTNHCQSGCSCLWKQGSKVADCIGKSWNMVPNKLSSEIQILELSENPLFELMKDAFHSVINLKKLYLKSCNLSYIHPDAFRNLRIMIELDLSNNAITTLDPNTFNDLTKLRVLLLNDNRLEKIKDGLVKNLEFLQRIELSNNRIFEIGQRAFVNLPKLTVLNLSVNKMMTMKPDILQNLTSLNSVVLHNNPWKCDCALQPLRNFLVNKNLYAQPTACAEPPDLQNRFWSDVEPYYFACKPNIFDPLPTTITQGLGENVTLSCKAYGNPPPEINWLLNDRIIYGDPKKHSDHRYIITRDGQDTKWANLTIMHVKFHDKGDFTCLAKNPGGSDKKVITLAISRTASGTGGTTSPSDYWLYLILICVGAIILIILLLITTYCICRRNNIKRHSKSDMHSSNGEALIEGSVIPEMEKSLITTVNPVTKPPRKYDAPGSVISGGTEMSELNKTLLDNESVYAPNEDESRSIDFAEPNPKSSRDALSVTASNRGEHRTYPPDLLSFPPRGGQASPAASSASTAPDSSRLPPQLQQSPLHSPIYGTNPNLFKTLTHSRSQSPFTSPCTPAAPARIGYVTIPRRPRVPSWGSTASYMTVTAPVEYVEPVYDNLGLRTTADGSSVLSLNKAGLEQQLSPGMRGRPLPSTPGSYHGPAPTLYAPIEEQDHAPSPAPGTPYSATMPRISSNSFQFTPLEPEKKTSRPKMKTPAGDEIYDTPNYPLRDAHLSPRSSDQIYDTPSANDALARSSGKVPPRPPPKPKKKNASNGPLFEDEGEDGTEV